MVNRVDVLTPRHAEPYGNPAPLGLLGLSIGCAALIPIAFGKGLDPSGLRTAAMFVLLFGGGCQLLAGYMEFRNGNGFGGAIFTTFAFLWMMNAWELHGYALGLAPSHVIKTSVEFVLLLILVPLTFGFGYFSKLMFGFLVVIDGLFACKLLKAFTHTTALDVPIALLTMALAGVAIWIALAALINPVAGRQVFRLAGPLFFADKKSFDFSTRYTLFEILYERWKTEGFRPLEWKRLCEQVTERVGERKLLPDVEYLAEFGYVELEGQGDGEPQTVRLNARGVDLYEQLVLRKYEF